VKERWRNGVGQPDGGAHIEQTGPLAALAGFELPGSHGRSVVALTATDQPRLGDLLDVFEKPGLVSQLQGDLALVRPGQVDSLRVGDRYVVGFVPWYARVWTHAARHPVVLGVVGVVAGLLLALGVFSVLQRIAARRRGCNGWCGHTQHGGRRGAPARRSRWPPRQPARCTRRRTARAQRRGRPGRPARNAAARRGRAGTRSSAISCRPTAG
jgi:hypothetical protein